MPLLAEASIVVEISIELVSEMPFLQIANMMMAESDGMTVNFFETN